MASSCTITLNHRQVHQTETAILQFAWTADTDGSFTSVSTDDTDYNEKLTITDMIKGWEIYGAQTDPGTTAPTADYDITVTDAAGEDLFGTNMNDRSTSATESAVPAIGGLNATRTIDSALTLNIANNSVNGATGVVKLFLKHVV